MPTAERGKRVTAGLRARCMGRHLLWEMFLFKLITPSKLVLILARGMLPVTLFLDPTLHYDDDDNHQRHQRGAPDANADNGACGEGTIILVGIRGG